MSAEELEELERLHDLWSCGQASKVQILRCMELEHKKKAAGAKVKSPDATCTIQFTRPGYKAMELEIEADLDADGDIDGYTACFYGHDISDLLEAAGYGREIIEAAEAQIAKDRKADEADRAYREERELEARR
jgi:hypothetical protein